MVEILSTKEYNALMRCAMKECPEFRAVAEAQAALAKDLEQLARSGPPTPDRIKRIISATKALHEMEDRRRSLMCTIGKCAEAFVDLEMKKTDLHMEKLNMVEALLTAKKKDVKTPSRRSSTATKSKCSKKPKTGKPSS